MEDRTQLCLFRALLRSHCCSGFCEFWRYLDYDFQLFGAILLFKIYRIIYAICCCHYKWHFLWPPSLCRDLLYKPVVLGEVLLQICRNLLYRMFVTKSSRLNVQLVAMFHVFGVFINPWAAFTSPVVQYVGITTIIFPTYVRFSTWCSWKCIPVSIREENTKY